MRMVCERCGYELAEHHRSPICPACGTRLPQRAFSPSQASPHTGSERRTRGDSTTPTASSEEQETAFHGSQPISLQNSRSFSPQMWYVSEASSQDAATASSLDRNVLIEFILSLLGIFGIGWLLAGELVIGIALLIGSILIYWPIMFLGTIVTLGFALICLGPLAVGAIILNAYLLHRHLKRKTLYKKHYRSL